MMNFLKNRRGQIQLLALGGAFAAIASIGAPFLWVGSLKATNEIQDVKIIVLERNIEEIKTNVEYIRRAVEQMSSKQGIQGVQGVQGTTGVQGVQGFRGVQGVPGLDGIDGVDGVIPN